MGSFCTSHAFALARNESTLLSFGPRPPTSTQLIVSYNILAQLINGPLKHTAQNSLLGNTAVFSKRHWQKKVGYLGCTTYGGRGHISVFLETRLNYSLLFVNRSQPTQPLFSLAVITRFRQLSHWKWDSSWQRPLGKTLLGWRALHLGIAQIGFDPPALNRALWGWTGLGTLGPIWENLQNHHCGGK